MVIAHLGLPNTRKTVAKSPPKVVKAASTAFDYDAAARTQSVGAPKSMPTISGYIAGFPTKDKGKGKAKAKAKSKGACAASKASKATQKNGERLTAKGKKCTSAIRIRLKRKTPPSMSVTGRVARMPSSVSPSMSPGELLELDPKLFIGDDLRKVKNKIHSQAFHKVAKGMQGKHLSPVNRQKSATAAGNDAVNRWMAKFGG